MSATELPPRPWTMACGCTTTAVQNMPDGSQRPVCFPHFGIDPGASTLVEAPDVTGRVMRCAYASRGGPCPKTRHGGGCSCEKPSSSNAAFFASKPDKEFDEFYCGCWGWD